MGSVHVKEKTLNWLLQILQVVVTLELFADKALSRCASVKHGRGVKAGITQVVLTLILEQPKPSYWL